MSQIASESASEMERSKLQGKVKCANSQVKVQVKIGAQ